MKGSTLARSLVLTLGLVLSGSCSASKGDGSGVKDANFYYSLAVNYYYDQKAQLALKELENCFALNPLHAAGHNLAGLIYMGRMEYADSLVHLKKAVELEPGFLMARANLGALYIAMQNWQDAIKELEPLLKDPNYPTPYIAENNVGWSYYKLGNYLEAEKHLIRAVLLNDDMCLAYKNLGMVHIAQNREDEAKEDFEAALKRCPQYVEAYFRAGVLAEKNGRYDEAAKLFEKCAKLGGESGFGRRCNRKLQVIR